MEHLLDEQIQRYQDGDSDRAERASVLAHLRVCPLCRKKIDFSLVTGHLLQALFRDNDLAEHLTSEQIIDFVNSEAALSEQERRAIQNHLDNCPSCQTVEQDIRHFSNDAKNVPQIRFTPEAAAVEAQPLAEGRQEITRLSLGEAFRRPAYSLSAAAVIMVMGAILILGSRALRERDTQLAQVQQELTRLTAEITRLQGQQATTASVGQGGNASLFSGVPSADCDLFRAYLNDPSALRQAMKSSEVPAIRAFEKKCSSDAALKAAVEELLCSTRSTPVPGSR